MDYKLHTLAGLGNCLGITYIPFDSFHRQIGQGSRIAGQSRQHTDLFTALDQKSDDVVAEEARCPGHQVFHCSKSSGAR
jgi:hypothetical protein